MHIQINKKMIKSKVNGPSRVQFPLENRLTSMVDAEYGRPLPL